MPAKRDSLIEIKGAMLPVLSVILRSLDPEQLQNEARRMFGEEAFFDGDLAALDLGHVDGANPDWPLLSRIFADHGLRIIGTRGGSAGLVASASAAGLPPLAVAEPPARSAIPTLPASSVEAPPPVEIAARPGETATPAPAPTIPAEPPPAPAPSRTNTIIIDRPLRSGQQVYARGGDVIVLAVVNTGAEVIADGNIHIYAPLRGRALAGAGGDTRARIFTARMEAELVSIAGLYRTFDDGVPAQLLGKPAQVRLVEESAGGTPRLVVEPLVIG